MCQISTGERIVTQQDVQNLITAVILRQQGSFSRKYVQITTRDYMAGSQQNALISEKELKDMIDRSLRVFSCNNAIKYVTPGVFNSNSPCHFCNCDQERCRV